MKITITSISLAAAIVGAVAPAVAAQSESQLKCSKGERAAVVEIVRQKANGVIEVAYDEGEYALEFKRGDKNDAKYGKLKAGDKFCVRD